MAAKKTARRKHLLRAEPTYDWSRFAGMMDGLACGGR